jgi:hypothetical protein
VPLVVVPPVVVNHGSHPVEHGLQLDFVPAPWPSARPCWCLAHD